MLIKQKREGKISFVEFFIFRIHIILLLFLLPGSQILTAEKPLNIDLDNAKILALKYNRDIRNARLDIKIAKNKVWETTATGLPQIDGNISYQDMAQIPTTLIPAKFMDPNAPDGTYFPMKFGTQHNMSFEVVASQLIFNGTYIVALQSTKIFMRLSKENLIKSELEVKSLVEGTYYLILISENLESILEKNLKSLKKLKYETSELFKEGFLEETDVDQVDFFITGTENRLNSIKRQIKLSYNLLKLQIGLELKREIKLTDSLNSFLEESGNELLTTKEFDLNGHIDFKMAETQIKSASLLLKKEKSLFLPTISAFVSHKQSAMRNDFNFLKENDDKWFPSTIIGLNMNIPIFSSGMRIARVKQYKYDLKKAINVKENVKDGLKLNLLKIKSAYMDAIGEKESTYKNLKIAEKIYKKTIEKFKEGVASSIEMIQIYNQFLESQFSYTSALIKFFNALTEYKKFLNII